MPFVPCPLVAEATLKYDYDEQDVRTVLHFVEVEGVEWNALTMSALGARINTEWAATLRPKFNSSVDYLGCTVRSLVTVDAPAVEVPIGVALAGTYPLGQPLPPNCALAIKKITGLSGRSHRGRIFHTGLTTDMLENPGQVTATIAGEFADAYDTFFTALEEEDPRAIHVVLSRFSGVANVIVDGRYKRQPIPREVGVHSAVLFYGADNTLDSQRRRLPGRGR